MHLTLNKAAQTCGRSKATLLAAMKSGRLSASRDDRGRYAIEPAELHRVFPFQMSDRSPDRFPEPQPTTFGNHPTTSTDHPVEALKREVELLREMLTKTEANADHWRAIAERQQALLEDKRPREARGFLQRLLGR